jgi:hypothetical protein
LQDFLMTNQLGCAATRLMVGSSALSAKRQSQPAGEKPED